MGTSLVRRPSLTRLAHDLVAPHLPVGGLAVDATVGNGHDLAFLARMVGEGGGVIGFDIQQRALDQASGALDKDHRARVQLIRDSHARMAHYLGGRRIHAAMFNLGYLPGGDHSVITCTETTITALSVAVDHLLPGGCISVLAYTGHPGGRDEADAVDDWCRQIESPALQWRLCNPTTPAAGATPQLYLISRHQGIS